MQSRLPRFFSGSASRQTNNVARGPSASSARYRKNSVRNPSRTLKRALRVCEAALSRRACSSAAFAAFSRSSSSLARHLQPATADANTKTPPAEATRQPAGRDGNAAREAEPKAEAPVSPATPNSALSQNGLRDQNANMTGASLPGPTSISARLPCGNSTRPGASSPSRADGEDARLGLRQV